MRWTALALTLLVSGCVTGPDSWCLTNRPERPSAKEIAAMTDARVDQTLTHNQYGEKRCGWKP